MLKSLYRILDKDNKIDATTADSIIEEFYETLNTFPYDTIPERQLIDIIEDVLKTVIQLYKEREEKKIVDHLDLDTVIKEDEKKKNKIFKGFDNVKYK